MKTKMKTIVFIYDNEPLVIEDDYSYDLMPNGWLSIRRENAYTKFIKMYPPHRVSHISVEIIKKKQPQE